MRRAVNPKTIWAPFGAHSMAVIGGEGKTIHLGGQVAFDLERNIVGEGDIEAQTRQTFENIRRVLETMGGDLDDVVSMTTYVTGVEGLKQIHAVRTEIFSPPYPASTLVTIAGFVDPRILIEITAVAIIPAERFTEPDTRENPYFSDTGSGFSL